VIAVRRGGDALGTRKLHSFESGGKRVFEERALVGRKFPEHVADHVAGLAGADADFEAREEVGPEVFEDGFDAIVATGGAFFAEPQGAERQGGIVVDDEHVFRQPFVEGENLADGAAAEVHEGLGFEEQGCAIGEFGEVALPFGRGLERDSGGGGQTVQDHEPDVVAGVFILPPRVAEADDEGEGHGWEIVD